MSHGYSIPTTLTAVRNYVTAAPDDSGRSADTLTLNVSHSNLKKTHLSELRFNRHTTIDAVKQRLYLHTGTRPAHMTLTLRTRDGRDVALVHDDHTLAHVGVTSGDTLFLVDDDPFSASAGGWLEDTSLVPKFELSEEQYAAHPRSYRRYKEEMRQRDPTWSMTSALALRGAPEDADPSRDIAEEQPCINVGDRVEVFPGGRRAEVKFVGRGLRDLPKGWWIGVEYDEPVGRNDGTVQGVRYFNAAARCGGFVRPSRVTVGDFPPQGDGLDDDDDDEL